MRSGKKSFVLYKSWEPMINTLDDESAGILLKAILAYQCGKDYEIKNPVLLAVFEVFKNEFDENDKKYEERCARNKRIAQKRWQTDESFIDTELPLDTTVYQSVPECTTEYQNVPKHADSECDYEDDSLKRKTNKREAPIEVCKEIITTLNAATGCNYKASSSKTRTLINARLNEGYTVDDFKTVIAKKAKEWMGTEREKFLRPETLFGTKFEGYLNQPPEKPRSGTNEKVNKFNDFEQRDRSEDEYAEIERAMAVDW